MKSRRPHVRAPAGRACRTASCDATERMMTGPCNCSALVSDCRYSMLATRSPSGAITREAKVCTGATGDTDAGGDACAPAASARAARAATRAAGKNACIFIDVSFLRDKCAPIPTARTAKVRPAGPPSPRR
jgi:hypothetical protein